MILAAALLLQQQPNSPFGNLEHKSAMDLANETHVQVVRAEREFQFFAGYTFATPQARARARTQLERLHTPGAAGGSSGTTQALAKATRALEEAPAGAGAEALREAERLQDQIDALDVQALPLFFSSNVATEGQVLRVCVYPIYAPSERVQATFSLHWTNPAGEQWLAYRGLAKAALFDPPGFTVEVAAPGSEAGRWLLTPELERNGVRVLGSPLELQSVPRLVERSQALFSAQLHDADPLQSLARWIALASQRGMRTLALLDCDAQLARLAGAPHDFEPYPWALAFQDENADPHWIWRLDPLVEARATLVLLTPSAEPPEAQLARPEWRDLVRLDGWRILATHLPRTAAGEAGCAALFARLGEVDDEAHRVCLARGDAIGRLAMAFHGQDSRPYAAEILAMSEAPADPDALGGRVPRLVFAPGGRGAGEPAQRTESLWWIEASSIGLISSFELPTQVREALPKVWPKFARPAQERK